MFGLTPKRTRRRARGQTLVELALTLPALLLIVLVAIDFGRAFFGYVVLTNASRIGANYAASHPEAWGFPGNAAEQDEYEELILRDTDVANCALVGGAPPDPTFRDGSDTALPDTINDVGDRVDVGLSCTFKPLTPIISAVVGGALVMSANSDFAIRAGTVSGVPIPPPPTPGPTPVPTPTADPGATPIPTPNGCSFVVVPDVDGMTPANASSAISGEGLVPDAQGDLTTGQKNSATNQSPAAGACVASGTTVTYHYRPS